MGILEKIVRKINIEKKFFLEQKTGWRKPEQPDTIPKYLLKKFLPANPVIIDCGAHVGADAIELARIFPDATIHCFEPVPEIFAGLQHNTRKYDNIKNYNIALSSFNGTSKMYVSSGSSDASSSLNKPKDHLADHPTVYFDNVIEVKTCTLDTWAAEHNIPGIYFLWLDMQGHEYEMLNASPNMLSTVNLIHTEVSTKEAYEKALLYTSFKAWLGVKGFQTAIEAVPAGSDMGNVLFTRRK